MENPRGLFGKRSTRAPLYRCKKTRTIPQKPVPPQSENLWEGVSIKKQIYIPIIHINTHMYKNHRKLYIFGYDGFRQPKADC